MQPLGVVPSWPIDQRHLSLENSLWMDLGVHGVAGIFKVKVWINWKILRSRIGSSKSLQAYSFLPVEEPVESEGL